MMTGVDMPNLAKIEAKRNSSRKFAASFTKPDHQATASTLDEVDRTPMKENDDQHVIEL